jgi:hypothetical protein
MIGKGVLRNQSVDDPERNLKLLDLESKVQMGMLNPRPKNMSNVSTKENSLPRGDRM